MQGNKGEESEKNNPGRRRRRRNMYQARKKATFPIVSKRHVAYTPNNETEIIHMSRIITLSLHYKERSNKTATLWCDKRLFHHNWCSAFDWGAHPCQCSVQPCRVFPLLSSIGVIETPLWMTLEPGITCQIWKTNVHVGCIWLCLSFFSFSFFR